MILHSPAGDNQQSLQWYHTLAALYLIEHVGEIVTDEIVHKLAEKSSADGQLRDLAFLVLVGAEILLAGKMTRS